jgi:hypothetical protein
MNLFDLFEGAIDDLEARRIEDLEAKMDDCMARAKQSNDPKYKEAMRHAYAKAKAERDSYYKLNLDEADKDVENIFRKVFSQLHVDGGGGNLDYILSLKAPTFTSLRDRYHDDVTAILTQTSPKELQQAAEELKTLYSQVKEAPGAETLAHNQSTEAGNLKALGLAEVEDTNYTYTVFIDGTKEGTYGSKEEAKAVVSRKKEQAPGREYTIKPKSRTSMSSIKKFQRNRDRKIEEDDLVTVEGYALQAKPDAPAMDKATKWKWIVRQLIADYANNPRGLLNVAKASGPNSPAAYAYKYMLHPTGKLEVPPPGSITFEGSQDFNKVEPYEVFLAGKPVKQFDYYEYALRFHDNWKKKLYNQGEKEKADKITLNPIMKEENERRVDPILIKALNNMPDGLATHREVLDAAYDAYTMEVGKIHIKQNYGVTNKYIPQLMGMYKDKHSLDFKEAANPAQQAAIAIAKKKQQKVDENNPSHQRGPKSMNQAAQDPTGPKFGGYLKGTDPAPTEYSKKSVGSMEEGIDGNMTARSNPLTQPLRKRQHMNKNTQVSLGKHNNALKAAAARGLDEMTNDEVAKLRADADAGIKSTLDKQSNARIAALKNPPKEKSFMQKVGDKQIGMVKGAWKGLTGQLEEEDMEEGWKNKVAGAALAGAAALGAGGAHAGGVSTTGQGFSMDDQLALNQQMQQRVQQQYDQAQQQKPQAPQAQKDLSAFGTEYLQKVANGQGGRAMVSVDDAKAELAARASGKSQQAPAPEKVSTPHNGQYQSLGDYYKANPGIRESNDNFLTWAVRNGFNFSKDPAIYESARKVYKSLVESKKKTLDNIKEDCGPIAPHQTYYGAMDETKGLGKRVRVVSGPAAGETGTIGEVRNGAFQGAPKYYTVDLDNGGHIQVRKEALKLIKDDLEESLKPGEYFIWTVYFDDGTSKRIKVKSDEFDPYAYYARRNETVVNVDYNWEIHQ